MRTLKLEDCSVEIIATHEETNIRKELGFDVCGVEHTEYINKVLEDDGYNVWLWAMVEVKVAYKSISSSEYLGQCCYESEEDFITGGYYEDMVNTCLSGLNEQLFDLVS